MLTRSIAIHRPHILTAGTGLYPASTSGPTISPFSVKLKLRRYHHVTPVSNRTPVKRITSALVQGYGKAATATAILPTAIGWGCRFFGSDNNHGHGHQSPSPVPSICESDLQCTRNTRFPIIYHTNFLTENGMIKSPMGVIGPAHTYNKLKRYKGSLEELSLYSHEKIAKIKRMNLVTKQWNHYFLGSVRGKICVQLLSRTVLEQEMYF